MHVWSKNTATCAVLSNKKYREEAEREREREREGEKRRVERGKENRRQLVDRGTLIAKDELKRVVVAFKCIISGKDFLAADVLSLACLPSL